ncbi:hydroxypyruvate isomerase [Halopseudomonas sabulinigri]|uniref:Hydroxypyruvate isomerase n=1 Tax=Halopseudomonas sabulinigri TaxID=472181 RepID=A0A1H1Q840_9GAMM|nr:TIM barrel protein [Halopseudomonas sabulinigri]SDS19089.1 hydroxypyruvate isomerase [Halopseudomonas sabulinigri]
MQWKLAANLSMLFTEQPLLERIAAATQAGFDGVEVQFPYGLPASDLQAELQRQGMPLVLFNLPAGDLMDGGPGLAAVPGRETAFAQALQQALDYADVLQPQKVNVLPGKLARGVSEAQALDTLEHNLRLTAEAFAPLGVAVVCEAINRLDMPGFLLASSAELAAMLARVAHPNLSAQLDFYHMARMGEPVALSVRQLAGQIGHVQFADVPGRGAPGSGELDFRAAFQALDSADYRGWLAAEYRAAKGETDRLAWLAAWRAAGWVAPR